MEVYESSGAYLTKRVQSQIYSDTNIIVDTQTTDDHFHTALRYQIDTSKGQSGSGLLMYKEDGSLC